MATVRLKRKLKMLALAAAASVFLISVALIMLDRPVEVDQEPIPPFARRLIPMSEEPQPPKTIATTSKTTTTLFPPPRDRPWFMYESGGEARPTPSPADPATGRRTARLLPEEDPDGDRIVQQLMFVPPRYGNARITVDRMPNVTKTIFLRQSLDNIQPGTEVFDEYKCPVKNCRIVTGAEARNADLVVFNMGFSDPGFPRPKDQLWMLYMLESPHHSFGSVHGRTNAAFNWTATYRSDSTIPTPYARWEYYNEDVRAIEQGRNYAANKTKAVAWFVSNCGSKNNRLKYAKELQKHIQVDIYGSCGSLSCPRGRSDACNRMLETDYKFYLSFENSNCRDYITEKFFFNALKHEVVPIVMGAHPDDYRRSAPQNSFIHVDDFAGPKELAEYLHTLDQNDDLYNEYFKWKGTGELIKLQFICRICALLNDDYATTLREEPHRYYRDLGHWWKTGPGICTEGQWRDLKL